MQRLKSKRILAAGAALALVGGAGGAVAASKGSATSGNGFVARVAAHLGISTQKLEDATKAAAIDQVDADLKAGRITKAEADALKARIRAGEFPFFAGPGPRFGDFGRGPHGFGFRRGPGVPHGGHLSAAADYLGLSVPQVLQKLANGQTLAEIAKAQHKSVSGLEDAMLADAKTHLDRAVKDGLLTRSQADEMLSMLKSKIGDIVNGKFPQRREFHWRNGPPEDDAGPWMMPAA
jgi:hypothetical protein